MCVCEMQAKDGPLPPCQCRVQPTAVAGALVLVQPGGRPCPVPDVGCLGTLLVDGRRRCSKLGRARGTLTVDVRARDLRSRSSSPADQKKEPGPGKWFDGRPWPAVGQGPEGVVVGC